MLVFCGNDTADRRLVGNRLDEMLVRPRFGDTMDGVLVWLKPAGHWEDASNRLTFRKK